MLQSSDMYESVDKNNSFLAKKIEQGEEYIISTATNFGKKKYWVRFINI